jgi:signal transduction histidine kinase
MLEVLGTQASHSPGDARTLLHARVMPGRELVIQLEEQAQALNRRAFVQQQSAIADTYGVTERRIWQSLGLALATSLGIALIATLYAGRLEDRVKRQRERDAESARDLQRLSAKLLSAQEDERRSIARELHDEIGQALTAIKVELSLAEHAVNGGAAAATALGDARKMVDAALQAVRDLSHLLRPSVLDDLGLVAALNSYLKGFGRRHSIRVELVQEGMDERVDPGVETAVYRIVQEALTNVSKHAHASSCRIGLRRLARTLVVTVEDDGVGFDPARLREGGGVHGLGLLGVRERAAQLGASVRLESSPEKGTRLTIEVPTAPPAAPVQPEPSGGSPVAVSVAGEALGG